MNSWIVASLQMGSWPGFEAGSAGVTAAAAAAVAVVVVVV